MGTSDRHAAAVIGGGGLVGAYLVKLLREERPGWSVRVIDSFTAGSREPLQRLDGPQLEVAELDIRDGSLMRDALADRDVVFHLAALLSLQMRDQLREAVEVNVLGALNVIEACASRGARLVLSSSITVFGRPIGKVDERLPFAHAACPPTSALYGATKLVAEYACAVSAMRWPDFSWVALRYSTVYGRRQHRRGLHQLNIVDNLDRLSRGERPRYAGAPEETHDYLHASDAARANLLAAEVPRSAANRSYVIASGVSTSNRDIARVVAETSGHDLAADWAETADDSLRVRTAGATYDISAARDGLGYEPRTGISEGIADLDRWLAGGA